MISLASAMGNLASLSSHCIFCSKILTEFVPNATGWIWLKRTWCFLKRSYKILLGYRLIIALRIVPHGWPKVRFRRAFAWRIQSFSQKLWRAKTQPMYYTGRFTRSRSTPTSTTSYPPILVILRRQLRTLSVIRFYQNIGTSVYCLKN